MPAILQSTPAHLRLAFVPEESFANLVAIAARAEHILAFRYLWAGAAAIAVSMAGSPRLEAQDSGGGIYVPFDFSGVSGDLAVEVDGIDMTAYVELAEGGILIRPEFPLDPGTYEVVLYLWQGDDYQVLAVETHTVEGGGGGGAEFTVTATHEAGARSLNGDETDEFARSSGEVEVRTVDNRLNARAAWLATTEEDEELAGRPIDLGEYFIEFNQQSEQVDLSLRLGNQALSYDRALAADITQGRVCLGDDHRSTARVRGLRNPVERVAGIQKCPRDRTRERPVLRWHGSLAAVRAD